MLYKSSLFLIAILPIIILGWYIYYKDKEKEPKKLLLKLFIGGILAIILTLITSVIIDNLLPFIKNDISIYNNFELIIYSFIVISLVEELSKWLIVYLFSYHNKEFDQLYDMIVYSAFVALGFAFIENILYVYDGGLSTALIRFFSAVPAHISVSIFMGYYLSLAKLSEIKNKPKLKTKYIFLSIIIPIFIHGIYDYCLLSSSLVLLFIFLIFLVYLFYKANKKISLLSKSDIKL